MTTLAVTQEVLVPMQGGEFLISGKRSMERPVVFNSHGTFFAFAGAFDGLAELIRKKAGRTCIGFSAGTRTKQQEFILDAIRDYGYIREWVNRLTAVMFLPDPQLGSLEEAASGGVHYLGVTSRLGAWPYRDLLVSVAEEARHGRLPVGPFPRQSHLGLAERCYKERNYIGRYFSSLVAHASRQPKTIEERNSNDQTVLAMVRAGDWGTVSFRGLDSTVLRHIQEAAWDDLLAYCHETRSEELGRSFTSDGVMCETHKVNVGDTDEIADITTQLPQRIRDRL